MNTLILKFGRALLFAVLTAFAGSALATATFGTRADNYCASRPTQATAPQQSRPYRAASFSCFLCHTGSPSGNNLNAFGNASLSCTSTTCGAAMNPFCVATPPSNATITAPPAGTTVAQGQSLTYTAGNATNPDGFPLTHTWLFTGGMPNATGQSVSVPMTVAGAITSTLQVRNSVGMLATGTPPTRSVTVTGAANQPPAATINAPAANVTVAQGGTVNFQGSGTDPNNNLPLTYSWNFGGGAPNSTAQSPGAVTFNTAGTFTVTFTVTDSLGLASTPVSRMVTVTAVGQQPVAIIEEPRQNRTIAQGRSIEFHGKADSDEEDDDLRFNWSFPGGTPATSTRKEIKVFFNNAGTFTATLTVTDSQGRVSAPVSRVITVTGAANMAPTATINAPAANVTVAQGGTVDFQGSGTDPNNNLPLTYSWNFGGGAPNSTAQNPGAVTFNTAGTFTVTFTVTDSLGLPSAAVTRTVTVTPPANQPPVATINAPADNVTIAQGGTVNFQGSGTDPDNNLPLTYSWNFGGGAPNSTQQNPGAVTFNTAGTFTVSFTVTDSLGLSSAAVTRTITVTAAPQQPAVSIVRPAMNVSVLPGGTVTFSGSATGEANERLRFRWSFQGGSPDDSTRQNPGAVRFRAVGTHTVTLTVTGRGGRSLGTATRVITVAPPNQRPRLDDDCRNGDDGNDDDDDD